MNIRNIKKGDKVKWRDLARVAWVSEVIRDEDGTRNGAITVRHLGRGSSLIVLVRRRLIDHYTKENNPEEWL